MWCSGYYKKGVEISTNNPLVLHLHLQSSNPYLFMWLWASWVCFICSTVCWLRNPCNTSYPVNHVSWSAIGYIIGTIIVSISGTVAASVSFLIARYFSRDRILKLVEGNKKFLAIDKTRNATGLVAPAIAASLGALTYTLGTFVPMIRASGFATAAPVTAIETVAGSFR